MLYHYPTKRINETVNRNKQRFPENFCFQLTDEEYEVLRCKDITLNKDRVYKKILIIDNYVDDSILKMLTKKKSNVEVVILTSNKSNIQNIDIQKFNKEYPILKIAKTNKFHDRFIVLDNEEMYHLGASIKDLGKKCFGINKIEDKEIIGKIINL